MKFKDFTAKHNISFIAEGAGEHTMGFGQHIPDPVTRTGQSPFTDKGTFNLKFAGQIDALNAMLYTFSNHGYIDPGSVLKVAQQKLNLVGLDFNCPDVVSEGTTVLPLSQYSMPGLGIIGQNPYDDVNKTGFNQGDGIREKLGHGLGLSVNVSKMPNRLSAVVLTIVPM